MAIHHSSSSKPFSGQDAVRRQIFQEVCAEHGIAPGVREAVYGYFSKMPPQQLRSRLAAGGETARTPTLKEFNDLRNHLRKRGVRVANFEVAMLVVIGGLAVVLIMSGSTGDVIKQKVKKCTDAAKRQANELLHIQGLQKDGSNEKCFE